jgi:GT2 family glycosyltransferase
MFIFAWTDEWWRGGFEIEDWDFGLVDRQRKPKMALFTVAETMHQIPFFSDKFPFISVVICSCNGAATIRDTMESLQQLAYPNFEVIVIDDGSTDNMAQIVMEYPVKLTSTPNRGLSNARNSGMYEAKGEIIAYLDDDAYPDPQWLHYLAYAYTTSSHAGIGGPNICPVEDGPIAQCVANSPGGPVHVLVTDEIAEHIPGCNMSFRRKALMEIGGFDPVYRAAGDDVDVCWRIQEAGYTIGFHPSALVWHHRRNSLKAYWKQQKGYGKAEALLEDKWPEKYNGFGHLAWAGRIYGSGFTLPLKVKKDKIFHGTWGSALFQSVYQPGNGLVNCLPLMPEWYFVISLLGVVSLLGLLWPPLLWTLVLFAASLALVVVQAVISAYKNTSLPAERRKPLYYLLIVALHIIQPVARLYGRLKHGLTPWRKRGNKLSRQFLFAFNPRVFTYWCETWRPIEEWLSAIEQNLIKANTRVKRGGDFDRWDLQLRNGMISINRALLTIEEHGAGKQFVRLKTWCKPSRTSLTLFIAATGLSMAAGLYGTVFVSLILAAFSLMVAAEYILDTAILLHKLNAAFKEAAPLQNPILLQIETPICIEEASVIPEPILQKAPVFSNKNYFTNTIRTKLIRAKEQIETNSIAK